MLQRLSIDSLAPDSAVRAADGSSIKLSSLWQEGPVVLAFLRHFG